MDTITIPKTSVTYAEVLKALASVTDAFLDLNRCFPLDESTPSAKFRKEAMLRAYELVGPPNTSERSTKLDAGDKVAIVPDDFITHRASWRDALTIAKSHAKVSLPDQDDVSYWDHEIRAFDRAYQDLGQNADG